MQKRKLVQLIKGVEEEDLSPMEKEILGDIKWYLGPDAFYSHNRNIALRDNMEEELELESDQYPYIKSDLDSFLEKIGYPPNSEDMRYPNRN